ncbi:MAG: hypothetical protein AAFW74_11060 [Pseudomonadota bacterium]
MISRTSKFNLRVVVLAGLAMSLPVSQAHAYSVKYAPGYSSKRSVDVEFIYPKYPKGYLPAAALAADIPEDNRPEIVEYHVTTNKYVHITVNHVRWFYRPHIRVHRAATFHPSRIRLHRAGTFGY